MAVLLACLPAQAALQLQLDDANLSAEQRQLSLQLFDEVIQALPPRMRERLDKQVPVRWHDRLPDRVMGRTSPTGRISLNQRGLTALMTDPDAPNMPGREHETLRKELKATLIHELAHLYDRGRFWTGDQRQLLNRCRAQQRTLGDVGLPGDCRGQTNRAFTLSDDPRLLDLAGWPQQVSSRGQREQHNHQQLRSPDLYELHNPQEFVAVNLEYFLLDPDYRCRRPALAAYLRAHFDWSPAHQQPCTQELPYLNADLREGQPALAWLDPQRIYQAHYLLAEPDQSWAGRWGHSMLRLVVCAPGRPRGPDCLLDLQHHLVLSYRAFVDDVQLSSWDGLTGVYPSRLFILPLQRVIDEYTRTELRSLSSIPLQLSREQLASLSSHAISQHWSYDGTYYFVGNNCAVETLKLLRSGSSHPLLQDLDSQTPVGLLRILQARGLADSSPLHNRSEALRKGYYFDSYRDRYEQLFSMAREQLQLPLPAFGDWLALSASQRQPWIHQADRRSSAALLLLEQAALRQLTQDIQQDLKQRYLAEGPQRSELSEMGELARQLMTRSAFLSRPADLLPEGYGLPQPADRETLGATATRHYADLLAMARTLDQQLPELLRAEQRQQLDTIEQNILLLSTHLKELHQAAGGLVLP